MPLNHSQKVVFTILFVLTVIVIMLALAEGGMRLRQWLAQGHSGKISDLMQIQDGLRILKPGAQTRTIKINSMGFRGPELVEPKLDDGLRIAFVGGSTTFCAEVSGNDMAWPHLVTAVIQERYDDLGIDYVNAAAPGYTLKASELNYSRRVAPLNPDITVIYHATNDLSWEMRSLAIRQGVYRQQRVEKNSWLAEYSQLWYLVEKNLRIIEVRSDAASLKGRLIFSSEKLGEKFRRDLVKLVDQAKAVSKLVVLVSFEHRIRPQQTPEEQMEAAGSALYYMPFMTPEGLIAAFRRYNQIISEVAFERGVLFIDVQDQVPADSEHFNDSVHFKDAGSRVMAQILSDYLLGDPDFQRLAKSKSTELVTVR